MRKGFTLVELIVAMSVFVVAVAITSGVFVRAVKAQRQVNQMMVVNSDASLIIEKMAREIRSGFNFSLSNSFRGGCADGFDTLTFERVKDGATKTINYRWNVDVGAIERQEAGGGFLPLNAPQVEIERWCFVEMQKNSCDPWRVSFAITARPADKQIDYSIDMQSTVSARVLPVDAEVAGCT